MIYDVTGIVLFPGNFGKDCLGNGEHFDSSGNRIPICCDECEYALCCIETNLDCDKCDEIKCPRKYINRKEL